jgi:EAL domain-containing protein (putative c-di-GMP-specific phosphodiesterase class I)
VPSQPPTSASIDHAERPDEDRARVADRVAHARERVLDAIERQAFHPVFQPIRELTARRTVGFEGLARFWDRTPPQAMLEDALLADLEHELELATARVVITGSAALPSGAFVAINASAERILDDAAFMDVIDASDRDVVLEITEVDALHGAGRIVERLETLGSRVRVAVDASAVAILSIDHLLDLRPAFIKVDRELIDGIEFDDADQGVISSLLHLGLSTRSRVIAEGIETSSELDTLRGLGVELGQGDLLAKPATAMTWTAGPDRPMGRRAAEE